MSAIDWGDLQVFGRVVEAGNVKIAAERLGMSPSTVRRRLLQLEEQAATPLLVRTPNAPLALTARGRALWEICRSWLSQTIAVDAALSAEQEVEGQVVLAVTTEFARQLTGRGLPQLLARYPKLTLHIEQGASVKNLGTGLVDLAVRMFRPTSGDLVVRRLFSMSYAVYAKGPVHARTPSIGFTEALAHLDEAQYAAAVFSGRPQALRVDDVLVQTRACASGVGVAVLPSILAEQFSTLAVVEMGGAPPTREAWLAMHRDRQRVPAVRVVADWLTEAFSPALPIWAGVP